MKFALKVTNPVFQHHDFDKYPLIALQPWEMARKVQLALIRSRQRAFQLAIDEPCELPLSPPKGGTKRDFAAFASKIQLLSKKSLLQCFFVWKLQAAMLYLRHSPIYNGP